MRIVNLYKYLTNQKKEYTLSKQLLRCGTSVGANVTEAQRAQSKAVKEAYEVDYWLRLLFATGFIDENAYKSLSDDTEELIGLLVSICRTAAINK